MIRPALLLLASSLFCAPLGAGQALFRNASIDYGSAAVFDMKAGDINNDGKPDAVLLEKLLPSNNWVLLTLAGNGDGSFRTPVSTPITTPGARIALGDLDGDGKLDLVLSGQDTRLETYHGNGDGSFTLISSQIANIIGFSPLALTDLDGDGKLDLIAVTRVDANNQTLVTFRGIGNGTFAAGISQPGPFIQSIDNIESGDYNGDGRADVIESSFYELRLATGNGNGSVNGPTTISHDPFARTTAGGDFNGDGKRDIVEISRLDGTALVHLGNGNGTFTDGAKYVVGGVYSGVAADFDGDGKLDVVAGGNDVVTVMRGNGDGTFAVRAYVANSGPLAVADFDGDHHPDVLAVSSPGLLLLHGNGDGTLRAYRKTFVRPAPAPFYNSRTIPKGLAVADFNGDGKPDVVTLVDQIIVMLTSGDGLGPPVALALPPGITAASSLATGDVNGDGKSDIVVAGSKLWTYLSNGDGTFTAAAPTAITSLTSVFLADVNGDGKLDVLLGNFLFNGQLLLGNGDGTFALPTTLPGNPGQIADFNGDGRPDFVSTDINGMTIYLNNGSGVFSAGGHVSNTVGAIAVGDFNGDGKADLVEEQYNNTVRIRLGNGDGTFTDLQPFLLGSDLVLASSPANAVAADFDGDGKLDLAISNRVYLGKGDGTLRARVPCVVSRSWSYLAAADIDGNGSADLLLLDDQNDAVNTLLTRTAAGGATPLPLTLTPSLSTLHFQEPVALTTTATTSSTFLPVGGVTITVDGVFNGFANWNGNTALMTLVPRIIGDHQTIAAEFVGDDIFPPASVSVVRSVLKLDSVVVIEAFPSPSQLGQTTTITARIFAKQADAGPVQPSGTLTIRDGDTVLLSKAYDANHPPALTYKFTTVGTHALAGEYSGDANHTADTETFSQVVTKAIPLVGLSGTPASPIMAGQPLTLKATTFASFSGNGGTMTFREGGIDVGTAPTVGNVASITIQPSAGTHSYTAIYSGNADLDTATTNFTLDYTVLPLPCTTPGGCGRHHAAHP
ncbi:MAG TPA: FG-GAP-like repeat-containing protein [Thermoanaerobaculia bacterium]|nr:FG-GAP-like repeat-containing protein [Thermoanaerobaculia bacterium]